MKNNKIKHYIGVIALCTVFLVSACSKEDGGDATAATAAPQAEQSAELVTADTTSSGLVDLKMDDLVTFDDEDYETSWSADSSTSIEFDGSSATVGGSGATATEGGSVNITAAGTYVLSGKLTDGQVTIDAPDATVRVVLNGVELSDKDNAPFNIVEAGKVIVTLQEGTQNMLNDGADYVYADAAAAADEPDAALFSKADLVINGTGALEVDGNYKDGIASKDDLLIVSGQIDVVAADDGVRGKDRVAVLEGASLTVEAGGDGIKATNAEEAGKGVVAIGGGTIDIVSGNDAIQAETSLLVEGGTFKLTSGGGSANGETHVEERGFGGGGWGGGQGAMGGGRQGAAAGTDAAAGATGATGAGGASGTAATEAAGSASGTKGATTAAAAASDSTDAAATAEGTTATETESTSAKALKAGGQLQVNGGTFDIDAADDAVHSNGNVLINGGTFAISTGDDGMHADLALTIAGGDIEIVKSYEGLEGSLITISGGDITVAASDDGVNVAGGNDAASAGAGRQDSFGDGTHLLKITGGTLSIDANGDGLDSNGSIEMSGGTVVVNGPTGSGNGSVDYDGTFVITGGSLIAAGSSGMAQATSDTSTQQSILMTFPQSLEGGTMIRLMDGDGNEIAAFAPAKTFQSVLISSPDIKQGTQYVINSGDTKVVEFEVTSAVTWVNESGITTGGGMGMGGRMGGGGGMGGQPGERPAGGQRPDRGAMGAGGGQPGQAPAEGGAAQLPAASGDADAPQTQ
jgi:hypothetical protein